MTFSLSCVYCFHKPTLVRKCVYALKCGRCLGHGVHHLHTRPNLNDSSVPQNPKVAFIDSIGGCRFAKTCIEHFTMSCQRVSISVWSSRRTTAKVGAILSSVRNAHSIQHTLSMCAPCARSTHAPTVCVAQILVAVSAQI